MFEKEAEEYIKKDGTETEQMLNSIILSLTSREAFVLKNAFKQTFKDGAEFGYNKANEWHYPSKGELPECDETKKLWLYFKDYYANDRDCEHPFYRTSIGVYKTAFLNENVKVFAEKTKGYESEILLKDVIAWKEIVLPELKECEECTH